jgi:nucleoside-diphosphate-sugar epimerase
MTTEAPGLSGQTCLVTGASGFLGGWVVEKLAAQGARVRCLVRPTSRRDFLTAPGLEFAVGDVGDRASLDRAVAGVDVVFHVAGLIKARRPEDYAAVNVQGTINVLDACRTVAERLTRVVLVSSLAAVGPSALDQPVDETTPPHPFSPYGKSKLAAENAAEAYRGELPLVIVRPPTIYGPRDRETLLMFRLATLGVRPKLGPGEITVVHASDLADGILLAATDPRAAGETYFICGDESPSPTEMMARVSAAVGRRGVGVPVPAWAIRLSGRAADAVGNVTGVPFIFDRWKADELADGYWACSNRKAKANLGFAPRIPLADGLRQTAEWYRRAGWL